MLGEEQGKGLLPEYCQSAFESSFCSRNNPGLCLGKPGGKWQEWVANIYFPGHLQPDPSPCCVWGSVLPHRGSRESQGW